MPEPRANSPMLPPCTQQQSAQGSASLLRVCFNSPATQSRARACSSLLMRSRFPGLAINNPGSNGLVAEQENCSLLRAIASQPKSAQQEDLLVPAGASNNLTGGPDQTDLQRQAARGQPDTVILQRSSSCEEEAPAQAQAAVAVAAVLRHTDWCGASCCTVSAIDYSLRLQLRAAYSLE
eukprot:3799-Heterococcus_DN1.PRE.3